MNWFYVRDFTLKSRSLRKGNALVCMKISIPCPLDAVDSFGSCHDSQKSTQ
jgi:hypothetical protein